MAELHRFLETRCKLKRRKLRCACLNRFFITKAFAWGASLWRTVIFEDVPASTRGSWASERLARYKLPSRLETIEALPRNPAGKVLKFELRLRFAKEKE